jgi:hypothetical protein
MWSEDSAKQVSAQLSFQQPAFSFTAMPANSPATSNQLQQLPAAFSSLFSSFSSFLQLQGAWRTCAPTAQLNFALGLDGAPLF